MGLGLPMFVMVVLSQFTDPRFAVSLLLIPMVVLNAWQTTKSGYSGVAVKNYWKLYVPMVVGIMVFSQYAESVLAETMKLIVGIAVVSFVLTSVRAPTLQLPDRYDSAFQITAGSAAGVLGGFTATVFPPLIMYLTSRQIPKNEFVGVIGFMLLLNGVFLTIGYVGAGITYPSLIGMSALLVLPAALGMKVGEFARGFINESLFRTLILFVFFILGLNLIRVAIDA